jgi:Tfp pilus assembly protein PilF/V8-like Glu-specific endopeptidase
MCRSTWFLTAGLVGMSVALVQPALALSESEVKSIAKAVTVEIKLQEDSSVGSGVIIARQGDLYTIATNRHVVCGSKSRNKLPVGESYDLVLADGQHYRVNASNIKLLGTDLDLAIIQFRSQRNYAVAKVAPNDSLKVTDKVYTAGFPPEQPGFNFNEGKAIAVVNKRLTDDRGGYTIIYNARTFPGMSGGGVFDNDGLLVAIHGQGERYGENTDLSNRGSVDRKFGYNRGIPVRWLVQNLQPLSINLVAVRSNEDASTNNQIISNTASEHFIAGFSKFADPGGNILTGKRQAVREFSEAIRIFPKYSYAYLLRAETYEQLKEFQKALADYNQAIALDPRDPDGYNNRGIVKKNNFNDLQGALADYNQAISLSPSADNYTNRANLYFKLANVQGALADYNQAISLNSKYPVAYYNRAILKANELNDVQGSLSDLNQAISLNPKYIDAYYIRAILKIRKLNDVQGALSDLNQAISLNPKYVDAYNIRGALKVVKLNDSAGAIQDFRQLAKLCRSQGNTELLKQAIEALKQLGATE